MDKIKVFVATPTTGTIADAQSFFWRKIVEKYGDKVELFWPKQCVRRIFHDFARNEMVKEFLESPAEILFFLDSDVVPPEDLFDMVLDHKEWTVAGAAYPVFMTPNGLDRPQVVFTVYKGRGEKGLGSADVPASGKEFVDGLATGCMFVKRKIFELLPQPWFEFKYDETSRQMTSGEDLGFCLKVNDLGYKFYTDYSMICKHYKHVCLLEVNNYAMEYAKRSVQQYDALIRPLFDQVHSRLAKQKATPKLILPSRYSK